MKKKLLIVSYHFPPLNTMAAKRYGFMCKYFKENGYDSYILTVRPRSRGYLNSKLELPIPVEEEKIYRIGALGIHYPVNNFFITLLLAYIKKRGYKSRILEYESLGWYYKVQKEIKLEEFREIDVVIGTFPSIGNLLVAKYISNKLKVPFIAEIRDLISDYEEGYNRRKLTQKIEIALEKRILGKADALVVVTSGFYNILKLRYSKKSIKTIYNGWDCNISSKPQMKKEDYIYYAGRLYEHRVESLKLLFQVMKKNNIKMKVIIRSLGPDFLNEKLKNYIAEMGLSNQITLKSTVSEEVVKEEQSKAKINLLVSSINADDKALMTTLPGKLFELLDVESPILAVVNDVAEIGIILKETNKGIASIQEEKIVKFITENYDKYVGTANVEKFSRRNQAKELCEFITDILEA